MTVTTYVMPPVIMMIAATAGYFLARELAGKKNARIGLLLPLALRFPDAHPHTMLIMAWIPLFYVVFLRYIREESPKSAAAVGVAWGVAGLTHVMGTLGIGAVVSVHTGLKLLQERSMRTIKNYAVILAVGIPILMIYWGPLLFVYHAQTPNPYQSLVLGHYSLEDFTADMASFIFMPSAWIFLTGIALAGMLAGAKRRILREALLGSFAGLYLMGAFFILAGSPLIAYSTRMYFFALRAVLVLAGILKSSNSAKIQSSSKELFSLP
ncbi:glycosyltransferase family 39 protein [Thermococcus sp. M36]|uniref:glycosyltransferase family 39 protein n=1 Tax=Thermococcus sp. M36 TaxID=1638261 RepID=UPI00143C6B58|nr:glycosyltransferase family 39 protein [Thermococcus sp. M36]